MNNQEVKVNTRKQDEVVTNRILVVFSLSLLLLLAVLLISRYMNSLSYYETLTFCTIASASFGAIGAALVILALIMYKKDAAGIWFKRLLMFGGFALIVASVLLYIRLYTFRSFSVLYVAIPITAFLYMIFSIYQRDFFYQTIIAGCTASTLYAFSRWLHYRPWGMIVHITYIAAITLLVAAVVFLMVLKSRKGTLGNIKLLPYNTNYHLMFSTLGIMLLTIVTVLSIGSGIAFWAMIGVFGYLFVLAVYYTIKLI